MGVKFSPDDIDRFTQLPVDLQPGVYPVEMRTFTRYLVFVPRRDNLAEIMAWLDENVRREQSPTGNVSFARSRFVRGRDGFTCRKWWRITFFERGIADRFLETWK